MAYKETTGNPQVDKEIVGYYNDGMKVQDIAKLLVKKALVDHIDGATVSRIAHAGGCQRRRAVFRRRKNKKEEAESGLDSLDQAEELLSSNLSKELKLKVLRALINEK